MRPLTKGARRTHRVTVQTCERRPGAHTQKRRVSEEGEVMRGRERSAALPPKRGAQTESKKHRKITPEKK